ncbi:unnamed protein product [Clonostachys rosea f. rosea IK726]|uniref:Short-chain dehydrogenase/reductase family protein n=2 Tax=Bionectria ochroleuca TaxID=29856 RepID=A0A0B7KB47_BIOOC|nr:unnamed protein product [Clonostachys rosea f. rosea IK726]
MPSSCKNTTKQDAKPLKASKDMEPWEKFWGPVFYQNQFKTTLEVPSKGSWPDVTGKCAIVTGSNSGLGLESSKQLLSLGLSHLVMAVRSLERGRAAAANLIEQNPSAKIDVWQLDMESYDSIRAFVRKCQHELSRIDFVILNAGASPVRFAKVPATGHERTIQLNHISTALLAVLLLPVLKSKTAGPDPPVMTAVSSVMAHLTSFTNRDQRPLLPSFDDTSITPFSPPDRYGVSKLLCQLFFVRLAEKVDRNTVTINLVEPGLIKGTGLSREATGLAGVFSNIFHGIAGRPLEQGAATYLDAILRHGKESHGSYIMNFKFAPLAKWYYSDGKALADVIWTETLQELSSVNLNDIIASL